MQATTRGALLRGTTTKDGFGDEIDDNSTPYVVKDGQGNVTADYSDFPLGLTERSRREQDPASGMWSTVRYMSARVPWRVGAIISDGDRIRDNRTGLVYQLDEMRRTPRSISGHSSVTLNLRRAGG